MDEHVTLLRIIAENPDVDEPRLLFSDWLEKHDHHGCAEFIRLQIELARMDPSDERYSEKTARMRRCGVLTTSGKFPFFDHLPGSDCKISFHRGFITSLDTVGSKSNYTPVFGLLPLQALRTSGELVDLFKGVTKLKWLEFDDRDAPPTRLLEILGPKGWFRDLEELSLPALNVSCLEAAVITQFDLPQLRNFYLTTKPFYELGKAEPDDGDGDEDQYYNGPQPWSGLPDYLPKNVIPNSNTRLERFIWHSEDDCDFFNDEEWHWRGPTMETLIEHLTAFDLKQVEVVVDYDDHENGAEGVIAAPYRQNPLELSPTLEQVTVDINDLRLLEGSQRRLKELRVFGDSDFGANLFWVLQQSVCSELESILIEAREGWWEKDLTIGPALSFPRLKSLRLVGLPSRALLEL